MNTFMRVLLGSVVGIGVLMTQVSAETVRLATGERPPYTSENLAHYGLWSQIVTEAFAQAGMTVEYGFFPWKRVEAYVESGEWDGGLAFTKTAGREVFAVYPPTPIGEACRVFFYRTGYTFDWRTIDDLQGHRIGTVLGTAVTEALQQAQQAGKALTIEAVPEDLQNLKKLLADRIDIMPCSKEVCLTLLRENFTPAEAARVTFHPTPWECSSLYLIVSKKTPRAEQVVNAFEQGMRQLKDSGRYDQILADFSSGKE